MENSLVERIAVLEKKSLGWKNYTRVIYAKKFNH